MQLAVILAAALASALLITAPVQSRTWYVKLDGTGDAPTIQAAIDSSTASDTVLVGPGTYSWSSEGRTGDILIRLKTDIVLRGEAGASATILDAENHGQVLHGDDVGNARIEGLTITHGSYFDAGGIQVSGGPNLRITDCVVRENQGAQVGGGITCVGGTVAHCEIVDNSAGGGGPSGYGGGLDCYSSTIVGCIIRGNGADGQGAGGAGATMWDSTMRNCWIEGNVAIGGSVGSGGGGVAATGTGARDSIITCTFVANRAGGASALSAVRMSIVDCVFFDNESYSSLAGGGTISLMDSDMTRCTVVYNQGAGYPTPIGGILVSSATVRSTIVAWNEGRACDGLGTWTCCDLFGNSHGNALCGTDAGDNFSLDPQFCAVDPTTSLNFALQSDSPCAPGNHPDGASCGLIGAAAIGCAAVSIEATTWSRLKSLYR